MAAVANMLDRTDRLSTFANSGLIIQRTPLYCPNTRTVAYRLLASTSNTCSCLYEEDWAQVVLALAEIDADFLVRFNNPDRMSMLRTVPLPRNVIYEHPGHRADGGNFQINGDVCVHGWENLYGAAVAEGSRPSPTLSILIDVLALLRGNADLNEIVQKIKADPVIQYDLLRFLNTSHIFFNFKFRTYEQAVMMLGYRSLERWLATYLIWSNITQVMPELCRLALTRGRQMELLVAQQGYEEEVASLAYVTGVFSGLVPILGMPLRSALQPLPPDDLIVGTLIRRQGPLVATLDSVLATEAKSIDEVDADALESIGLTSRAANMALLKAMQYADRQLKRQIEDRNRTQ